ncbi:MAG TPA: hypothetical protein VFQ38_17180, partial [Longimicrobiales bacterium]|nr:hypothetical protein [Longimicrobiales bacterium]
ACPEVRTSQKTTARSRGGEKVKTRNGRGDPPGGGGLAELLAGLEALEAGDFSARVSLNGDPLMVRISDAFNRIAGLNDRLTQEVVRVSTTVGREGQMTDRASLGAVSGG